MEASPLRLSVFTIAYRSPSDCEMVIRDLRRQTSRSELEVIIVAPSRDGIDDKDFDSFGAWQCVILPEYPTAGEAKEAAVRAARAPYVTYAEEHSYFHERWAERVVAAHGRGHDVVGFAIENANPTTLTSWAHLYGQFGPAVAPVESGEIDFLTGHHVSYKTALLRSYGDLLRDVLEDECALFLDLRAKGERLFIAGDAISRHVNVSDLRSYVRGDYLGQRSFAGARAKLETWRWWKRSLYALATPLVPLVRLRRIVRDIKRTGRDDQMLPRILGPISLALVAGAWGEMLGYLFGRGDAAEQRAPMELQRKRFLARHDRWPK